MPEFSELMRIFTGLTAVTIVFLVAGGALIACNRTVGRNERNVFLVCLVSLACITLADWFTYLTDGCMPELRMVHVALTTLTFIVAPILPAAIANTIHPNRFIKWIGVMLAVHAVIELINVAGGFVFWVDADNAYHRGSLYAIYMAVYTVVSIYLIVETIRAARAYQTAQTASIIGIIACMFTGVIIQVVDSIARVTWPAVAMAVILYFMFYSDMVLRTDALTKLLNRRSFEDALEKPSLPFVAVVIDIDDFKSINDTYGHAFGDECLYRTAQMIRRAFGGAGLCYRTGGDEFAVIMRKRLAEADVISATLTRLSDEARAKDERMPGLSIGYSAASKNCEDVSAVFNAADQAMYQAKRHRKAR